MVPLLARRGWLPAAAAVACRPALWRVALRQVRTLARPGWWRHPPFLPLPSPAYVRFRLETAYGEVRPPAPADVVTYLEWCGLHHGRRGRPQRREPFRTACGGRR